MSGISKIKDWFGQVFLDGGHSKASAGRNETLAQEWTSLVTQWRACHTASTVTATDKAEIDALIQATNNTKIKDSEGWRDLNRAQQLVALHMSVEQLETGFTCYLARAKARKLTTAQAHEANAALFPAATAEQKRTAYLAVLGDVQSSFVYSRFLRRISGETTSRLLRHGLLLILIACLVLALVISSRAEDWNPLIKVFAMVAVFSSLGAFFSRVMSFSGHARNHSLSYDKYLSNYVDQALLLRVTYGVIGAIFFYFVLHFGLVKGNMFPDMDALWNGLKGPLIFNSNLAGLFVWSFVAGFSERLVPDTLSDTETKGKGSPEG